MGGFTELLVFLSAPGSYLGASSFSPIAPFS